MTTSKPKPVINKRAAARLAVLQALYQIELTGAGAEAVADEFAQHRLAHILEPLGLDIAEPAVDTAFFRRVLVGTSRAQVELDALLAPALASGWTLDRCGYLLRACLRAAVFELRHCSDIPVKVVINEYVDLAKLFLPEGEAGFVNAVLDGLAQRLRAPEAVV